MEVEIPTMSGVEFARAFALRPNSFAWFLGAGASAASGIPTGYSMIRDFKKRIFCQENKYSPQEVDSGDPLWAERIDEFFKRTNILPPDGDPEEYSAAFEAVYPNEKLRRQYIDDAVRKGTPCYGHRVLAALMSSRQLDCVFTTNFDALVERSATISDDLLPADQRANATVAAIDSAERAQRCLEESDWPLVAKLHGDYKSSKIKNTNSELETQDEQMRRVLVSASQRFGLVVVGYSGRDASIMETFEYVLREQSAYPAGFYWVTSSAKRLFPAVRTFLEHALMAGIKVAIVESKTFDELAGDVVSQIRLPDVLNQHVQLHKVAERLQPVPLNTVDALRFPVLQYSAIHVESIPTHARRITLERPLTTEEARKVLKAHGCRAVVAARGRELAVFGRDNELLQAFAEFGARLEGTIQLQPEAESWALGLIYDALTRALARGRPLIPHLKRTGHTLLVAADRENDSPEMKRQRFEELGKLRSAYGSLIGRVPKLGYVFSEAIEIKLEKVDDRWWFGFEPFTHVEIPREARAQGAAEQHDPMERHVRRPDASADWRRERWQGRYNGAWATIIRAWQDMLTSGPDNAVSTIGLQKDEGLDAIFKLHPRTGWSRPSHNHGYFDRTK
ncbi:SIR2 family protein [Herbaspirillum huttiense]|uniref:SIR2 family protein n=2 Tax=Herbaspirillum huttiense TaxID=863372 RepID=A0AAJ2HAK0_9BURK|nr:SIR2 family protein [Herbaspirillum huttiense]MDR9837644.1 SIR2 family protein [Herbaspirillum huttiense]